MIYDFKNQNPAPLFFSKQKRGISFFGSSGFSAQTVIMPVSSIHNAIRPNKAAHHLAIHVDQHIRPIIIQHGKPADGLSRL